MKIYLAGPLFTSPERQFNADLARFLGEMGHEVWLPQDKEPRELTAKSIFDMDMEGVKWANIVVACMDGSDPDSGTCFECGYAYEKKPIICYRTDFRGAGDIDGAKYNLMLWASANVNVGTNMGAPPSVVALLIHEAILKVTS
jgi:nucleoside 2-deoxyribosyltransferase